MAINLNQ